MNAEAEVLAANDAFYAAFNGRDAEAMEEIWSRRSPCACIHPGWNALFGRPRIMASWQAIFEGGGAPPVQPSAAEVLVLGQSAFVVCLENIPGTTLVATNIFVNEDGLWRMVHHQAAPIARAMVDPDVEPEPEPDTEPDSGGSGGLLN